MVSVTNDADATRFGDAARETRAGMKRLDTSVLSLFSRSLIRSDDACTHV